MHRSILLLHCYCTLIHHYYIIITSLLHHCYYWICVITSLLHCYYTVIICYYFLVITLLLPVITCFIITCYYNIVGSLLPIFARSITGNNGSIITCFAPPHFADVASSSFALLARCDAHCRLQHRYISFIQRWRIPRPPPRHARGCRRDSPLAQPLAGAEK